MWNAILCTLPQGSNAPAKCQRQSARPRDRSVFPGDDDGADERDRAGEWRRPAWLGATVWPAMRAGSKWGLGAPWVEGEPGEGPAAGPATEAEAADA